MKKRYVVEVYVMGLLGGPLVFELNTTKCFRYRWLAHLYVFACNLPYPVLAPWITFARLKIKGKK